MKATVRGLIGRGMILRCCMAHRRPALLVSHFGAVICAVTLFTALMPVSVNAYAIYPDAARWWYDYNYVSCGPASPGIHNPCQVSYTYNSPVTIIPGWAQTADAAAGNWRTYDDFVGGLLDFQYVYFDYNSQIVKDNILSTQVLITASDIGPLDQQGRGILGYTDLQRQPGTNILSYADVQMNNDLTIPWCTVADSTCPDSNHYALQTTMTHELGHALGLTHPVVGPLAGVVMECGFVKGENQLVSHDDHEGAIYHYGTRINQPVAATVACGPNA